MSWLRGGGCVRNDHIKILKEFGLICWCKEFFLNAVRLNLGVDLHGSQLSLRDNLYANIKHRNPTSDSSFSLIECANDSTLVQLHLHLAAGQKHLPQTQMQGENVRKQAIGCQSSNWSNWANWPQKIKKLRLLTQWVEFSPPTT